TGYSQAPGGAGGGMMNQLEKVTHMDLNGDGRVGGGVGTASQYNQHGTPGHPPNYNQYGGAPCPQNNPQYGGPGYGRNPHQFGGGGGNSGYGASHNQHGHHH
ncbi:unnamed protein product, partial [Rotaria sp. Silwood2]